MTPMHHAPDHRVGPTEPAPRMLEVASSQSCAHAAAAYALPFQHHGRYYIHRKTQALTAPSDPFRAHLGVPAELKIVADYDCRRVQVPCQKLRKLLAGEAPQALSEAQQ